MMPLESTPQFGASLTIVIDDTSLGQAKGKAEATTHLQYRHHI